MYVSGMLQSMIELSRTQDEEVGDGTTSVIVLGMFDLVFVLSIVCFITKLLTCSLFAYHVST